MFLLDPGDSTDGQCKESPCIAITEEDVGYNNLHNNVERWQNFRAEYPERRFCLLYPYRSDTQVVQIPNQALTENPELFRAIGFHRDSKSDEASDWFNLCGFGALDQDKVNFIGLYIDGHDLGKTAVAKSYNKFLNDVAAAKMKICEHYDRESRQDWIGSFMTNLFPEMNINVCRVPRPVVTDGA